MENQTTQTTPPSPSATEGQAPPIIPVVENKYMKFLNKKVLKMTAIVFGVFLVLVILVTIITKNINNIITPKNAPTPTAVENIIDNQNESTLSGQLAPEKLQLSDLKKQIDELDIEQDKLKPPVINFKINFEVKK